MSPKNKSVNNQVPEPVKLSHGQFVVYDKFPENVVVERVVNPLTQEDLADGWQMVLPRQRKDRPTHHYSVYLTELPQHLWKYLKLVTNEDGVQEYELLRDNIYVYSVKRSRYDNLVRDLFNQVTAVHPNMTQMHSLVSELESAHIKGWLMIRAKRMLE